MVPNDDDGRCTDSRDDLNEVCKQQLTFGGVKNPRLSDNECRLLFEEMAQEGDRARVW